MPDNVCKPVGTMVDDRKASCDGGLDDDDAKDAAEA